MGLFNFLKGNNAANVTRVQDDNDPWDMSAEIAARQAAEQELTERQTAERQQRKIVAALMGGDGEVDASALNAKDVELPVGAKEQVQAMMMRGEVDVDTERRLISSIKDPINQIGNGSMYQKMTGDRHQMRILGAMTTENGRGFKDFSVMSALNIDMFLARFPLPMDFEKEADDFLDMIERFNDKEKRKEYEKSMADFKKAIYGKRQEYWAQLKDLRKDAELSMTTRSGRLGRAGLESARYNQGLDVAPMENVQDVPSNTYIVDWSAKDPMGAARVDATPEEDFYFVQNGEESVKEGEPVWYEAPEYQGNNHAEGYGLANLVGEYEKSREWAPGASAANQVSRTQVKNGQVKISEVRNGLTADETCEDAAFVNTELQMYGVFDGAGGMANGREASHLAAAKLSELAERYDLVSGVNLAWALNEVNEVVVDDPNAGYATAVLAKVVEQPDGSKYLAYASAGDSRLYITHANGETEQITFDEGEGHRITNALGVETQPGESRVKQYADVRLQPHDKVLLCSDGITGDYGSDLMSNEEIGNILMNAKTPKEASERLVSSARKTDDRTAVVFGV